LSERNIAGQFSVASTKLKLDLTELLMRDLVARLSGK
jgi:hypothetical protein